MSAYAEPSVWQTLDPKRVPDPRLGVILVRYLDPASKPSRLVLALAYHNSEAWVVHVGHRKFEVFDQWTPIPR